MKLNKKWAEYATSPDALSLICVCFFCVCLYFIILIYLDDIFSGWVSFFLSSRGNKSFEDISHCAIWVLSVTANTITASTLITNMNLTVSNSYFFLNIHIEAWLWSWLLPYYFFLFIYVSLVVSVILLLELNILKCRFCTFIFFQSDNLFKFHWQFFLKPDVWFNTNVTLLLSKWAIACNNKIWAIAWKYLFAIDIVVQFTQICPIA